MSADSSTPGARFERLLGIMARLRAPGGCPWDREQTLESLKPYLIEEAYETLDALERQDYEHLPEELGDLQLQIVFQAQIAREEGRFDIGDVLDRISEKLIRRHPHVFGDAAVETSSEVVERWEQIKAAEKQAKPADVEASLLDGVARTQPALLEAWEIGKKVAKVGFDWDRYESLVAKLHEEVDELGEARAGDSPDRIEDEVGDLLFVAVNVARFLKINPELALRRTNRKVRDRFRAVEEGLRARGKSPTEASLDEMEELWQQAKQA